MKRMLPILAVVCLAAVPQAVLAGVTPGVNLAWDNCYGGVTPPATVNRSFACNTNTGTTNTMYGSYVIATALDSVNGNEMVLDLISASNPLPDWWRLGASGCVGRTGQPTASFDFTTGPPDCIDYWAGLALGAVSAYNIGFGGMPSRARILIICAIDSRNAAGISAGSHVYSFKLSISNARTVGTGLCAGCTDPVCIVLNSIQISQNVNASPRFTKLSGTPAGGNDRITWQGGSGADCLLVPVRDRTWGQVKSLYR